MRKKGEEREGRNSSIKKKDNEEREKMMGKANRKTLKR